ncbi:MAG TPA: 1-deoxy-D-xylulose-5-phosphate reductoisomerase [Paracoccaceae bacterium]|nr:1-deoxy-D-xylulose-5-phosphate reductoisomerase [Paracoccaceae bacterium]
MTRRISIFGATGSIGRTTVALLEAREAEAYEVVALSGGRNIALLADQARRLGARIAVTSEPACLEALEAALAGSGVRAAAGPEALEAAAAEPVDWTMSAVIGAAGLPISLAAARHGGVLALANKESLVCAGALLKQVCASAGTTLLPVDSEHSAVFQALRGERIESLERIVLTASGGPFRTWSREQMRAATPAEARTHPNWEMGERISIDSASMFNKALELIEARELFGLPPARIEAVIHPQSIVHALVGFNDGSIIAQMGPSDMTGPIGHALDWPERRPLDVDRLDFAALGRLDFEPADEDRFPALRLAREVMAAGGLAGAVFNAAKETALDGFIGGRIGFLDMATLVEHVLNELGAEAGAVAGGYGLADVMALDRTARRLGRAWVETQSGGLPWT